MKTLLSSSLVVTALMGTAPVLAQDTYTGEVSIYLAEHASKDSFFKFSGPNGAVGTMWDERREGDISIYKFLDYSLGTAPVCSGHLQIHWNTDAMGDLDDGTHTAIWLFAEDTAYGPRPCPHAGNYLKVEFQ